MSAATVAAVFVSYNVHGGVGCDGRFVPNRIVDVLRELDADVIGLQEVESRATGFDMLDFLARETGLTGIAGPTLAGPGGDYGNGLLTRHPVLRERRIDISYPGREPRGAIDAELDIDGVPVRVINTHLGLHPAERRFQVQLLLDMFEHERELPTIFMGDLNEWFLYGRPLRWLQRHFQSTPALASFPSRLPLLALDRIWMKPRALLRKMRVHRSRRARLASDHLPLVADMALPVP